MKLLSERLAALSSPCRELDALIAVLAGWHREDFTCLDYNGLNMSAYIWVHQSYPAEHVRSLVETFSNNLTRYHVDEQDTYGRYTASLDAITELTEREGHMWILEQGGENLYSGQVCTNGEYIGWISSMDAPTPAIALCIAFALAKEAQSDDQ